MDYHSIKEGIKNPDTFFHIDANLKEFQFSAAEIQGTRKRQEDSVGLANLKIANPQEYFLNLCYKLVEQNSQYAHGATAAMYYFNPQTGEITIANIGDSRVYLTIKFGSNYSTILLTEDHNLELPRVKKYVTSNGGEIFSKKDFC